MSFSLSRRRLIGTTALTGSAAIALSACGGGDGGGSGSGGGSSDPVTAYSIEPENPLVPSNTTESGGGAAVDAIFRGLITYDQDSNSQNELAESIESEDNKVWTIKIKAGKKFSNGEEITAQNFVDAWNYGAAAKNAQQGAFFYEPIKGYETVTAEGATEDKMEGLKAVDDTTLEVTLAEADVTFPTRLGYAAYAPLPSVAFEDMEAFGQNPIGWGPFKMDGEDAWVHDQEIRLVKNEDYDGNDVAEIEALTLKMYQSLEAGYTDLVAGNLDLCGIPSSNLDVAESDLDGRLTEREYAGISGFVMPYYVKGWEGEAGKMRRHAISMAIDRQEVIDVVLKGLGTPAVEFTAPSLNGYPGEIEGSEYTKLDPKKAKELWKKADEMDPWGDKPFELAYNADGGNKEWVDAVCNQIQNNLGIKANGKSIATFKELRSAANAEEMKTPFRSSWFGDYPSMYNFLGPLYAKGASSNDARYDNPAFDKTLSEGLKAESVEAANEKFVEADKMLLKDMPGVPLWYPKAMVGSSERVKDVAITWNGRTDYSKVKMA